MSRCVDCAWYPWRPGADTEYLPMAACSPVLPMRRWLGQAQLAEHACPEFRGQASARRSVEPKPAPTVPPRRARPASPRRSPSR